MRSRIRRCRRTEEPVPAPLPILNSERPGYRLGRPSSGGNSNVAGIVAKKARHGLGGNVGHPIDRLRNHTPRSYRCLEATCDACISVPLGLSLPCNMGRCPVRRSFRCCSRAAIFLHLIASDLISSLQNGHRRTRFSRRSFLIRPHISTAITVQSHSQGLG